MGVQVCVCMFALIVPVVLAKIMDFYAHFIWLATAVSPNMIGKNQKNAKKIAVKTWDLLVCLCVCEWQHYWQQKHVVGLLRVDWRLWHN